MRFRPSTSARGGLSDVEGRCARLRSENRGNPENRENPENLENLENP